MKKKLANGIRALFAAGITLTGVVTLLVLLTWIILLFIGGETAVVIEAFLYGRIFPAMYFAVVALAFLGIVYVYLTGIRTFRFDVKGDGGE